MIVHIVIFKFKDENKQENMKKVKEMLEDLEDTIEEAKWMEVGINVNESDRALDMSLYSTFESFEDLKSYAVHPEHLKVLEVIKEVTEYSKVVDYDLDD